MFWHYLVLRIWLMLSYTIQLSLIGLAGIFTSLAHRTAEAVGRHEQAELTREMALVWHISVA